MSVLLVVNEISGGSGDASTEDLSEALADLSEVEVWSCEDRSEFADRLRASATGVDHVVVAAGDGTLNLAIEALEDSHDRLIFGVIPMGTGNDLARTLGVPLDPIEAAKAICSGVERTVDVGAVVHDYRRRLFINACMGGFPVAADQAITEETKERLGPLAFWLGGAKAAADLTRYSVRVDGTEHDDVLAVGIGNGRTAGGGIEVFPEAKTDDGLLDICVMGAAGIFETLKLATKVKSGSHADEAHVTYMRASAVEIRAEPSLEFNVDGEVEGIATPLRFEIGGKVRFLVPAG